MATPPKPPPRPAHPPQANPRPPAAPTHASAPPAAKPEPPKAEAKWPEPEPKPAKHEASKVEVSALTLSFTTQTSVARLTAAHAEVAAWTHNLEHSLQADLDGGALTDAEAKAVAAKYEVKAPKAKGEPPEAVETTPEATEAAAAKA